MAGRIAGGVLVAVVLIMGWLTLNGDINPKSWVYDDDRAMTQAFTPFCARMGGGEVSYNQSASSALESKAIVGAEEYSLQYETGAPAEVHLAHGQEILATCAGPFEYGFSDKKFMMGNPGWDWQLSLFGNDDEEREQDFAVACTKSGGRIAGYHDNMATHYGRGIDRNAPYRIAPVQGNPEEVHLINVEKAYQVATCKEATLDAIAANMP